MADLWRSVRCQRCENMSMWKCWLMICQWVFVSENISMADPVIYLELSPVQHWELWFCDNEKHVTGESQNLIAAGTWTMSLCLMQAQIVQIMIIDASNTSRQSFPSNKQFPNITIQGSAHLPIVIIIDTSNIAWQITAVNHSLCGIEHTMQHQ